MIIPLGPSARDMQGFVMPLEGGYIHLVVFDGLTTAHRMYGLLMTLVRGILSTLPSKEAALLRHLRSAQQPSMLSFLPHTCSIASRLSTLVSRQASTASCKDHHVTVHTVFIQTSCIEMSIASEQVIG